MTPSGAPPVAHEHVDAGVREAGVERARDVAVADELDARARLAHLAHEPSRGGDGRG